MSDVNIAIAVPPGPVAVLHSQPYRREHYPIVPMVMRNRGGRKSHSAADSWCHFRALDLPRMMDVDVRNGDLPIGSMPTSHQNEPLEGGRPVGAGADLLSDFGPPGRQQSRFLPT
jgi:hypothetical protein